MFQKSTTGTSEYTEFTPNFEVCSRFHIGPIRITPRARKVLTDREMNKALARHAKCDFGEVTYDHHRGNLQMIAEKRGVVVSVYTGESRYQFCIRTSLDDFNPQTTFALMS